MASTTQQEWYSCTYCGREFTTWHWRNVHENKRNCQDKKYNCEKCYTRFTRKDHLKNHIKKNVCGQKIQCETCHRKFKKRSDLEMHQKTPCNLEYTCFNCGVYKTKDSSDIFWHAKYCTEEIK